MSSPFGIIGFLFSKNLPLLVGVIAIDYFGMYLLNLGELVENMMFFAMILLALILSGTIHSGSGFVKTLILLLFIDLIIRGGLNTILPKEVTQISMEKIVQSTNL